MSVFIIGVALIMAFALNGADSQNAKQKEVPMFRFVMNKDDRYYLMPWRDQIWIVAHNRYESNYVYDRKTGRHISTINGNQRNLRAGIHPQINICNDVFRKVVHVPQRGDVIIEQGDNPFLFVYENKEGGVLRGRFSKVFDFTSTYKYPLIFCQWDFDDKQVDTSVLYLCKKKHGAYVVAKHLKIESLKDIKFNSLSAFCMHGKEFLYFVCNDLKKYIYDLEGNEVKIDNIQHKVAGLWQSSDNAGIYRRVGSTSYFYDGSSAKEVKVPFVGGLRTVKTLAFYENPKLRSADKNICYDIRLPGFDEDKIL